MHDATSPSHRRRRLIALGIAVVVLGAGGTAAVLGTRDQKTFCTLQGYIDADLLGQPARMQDQSTPGRGCDGPETNPGSLTIGLDCKVREEDGTVIGTFEPNRDDGVCGHGGRPLGDLQPS